MQLSKHIAEIGAAKNVAVRSFLKYKKYCFFSYHKSLFYHYLHPISSDLTIQEPKQIPPNAKYPRGEKRRTDAIGRDPANIKSKY